MGLTVSTVKLQAMMTKAVKGASNNKFMPLTSMISIKVENNKLILTTTDSTNYLYITDEVECEDFCVTVQLDIFAKLISKLTAEYTTLETFADKLVIKSNGRYTIDLPIEEDGENIKFPNPLKNFDISDNNKIGTFTLDAIGSVLTCVKPALLTADGKGDVYYNYYIGECAVATNGDKITVYSEQILDVPHLISPEVMNLLALSQSNVSVYAVDSIMVFVSDGMILYSVEVGDIDSFNINGIKRYLEQDFGKSCKLVKNDIVGALDRVSLFTGVFDNGLITLTFTDHDISIESKLTTGSEAIDYAEINNADEEYKCNIDVNSLLTQIKSQIGDIIEIQYGYTKTIKVISPSITSIIALNI